MLMNEVRKDLLVLLEQPVTSFMFKTPDLRQVISTWGMKRLNTFLGYYGHDLLKPTHLLCNTDAMDALKKVATKKARAKHAKRMSKKREREARKGKQPREYYKKLGQGRYQGGKDLASSAEYPQRFASAILKCWQTSQRLSACVILVSDDD